ncbi:MAG: CbiX/SirB N-terminal domain-containing protein [Gemmobacter sp.]
MSAPAPIPPPDPAPRDAVIVAHGAPSDPAPQEAVLARLAGTVAALLPGWRVRGATLAAPGALKAALDGLRAPLVYPFFLAEGWFTGTALPARLKEAGAEDAHQLRPMGLDPGFAALAARAALRGAQEAGLAPAATGLLIAAHGGRTSRAPAEAIRALVAELAATTPFREVRPGYVEEAPFLADAARAMAPAALCLPVFALRAGHVTHDVREALDEAGFTGPLLPPIGEDPAIPALIAAALNAAASSRTG